MKQFLIVVFVMALVVFGYVLYAGKDDARPAPRQRPQLQGARDGVRQRPAAGRTTKTVETLSPEGKVTTTIDMPEGATSVVDALAEAAQVSWREMANEETLVRLEDAWGFDYSGVDFAADPLCTIELADGDRVEISRDAWRKYVVITTGKLMVEGEMLEALGRWRCEEYDTPYGLTESQWATYFDSWCKRYGYPRDRAEEFLALRFKLPAPQAIRVLQQQLYGSLAYFPPVTLADNMPEVLTEGLSSDDVQYIMFLANSLSRARQAPDEPASLETIDNLMTPMGAFLQPVIDRDEFRRSWTYLDGNMPDNAVAACFVGEVQDELMPPWLQPVGTVHYLELEDMWTRLEADRLSDSVRHQMLRQTIWHEVLNHALEKEGVRLSPEENWFAHADEFLSHQDTFIKLDWKASGILEFPTINHYRAMEGVRRGFERTLPEDWDSDENLANHYETHRLFCETWEPQFEFILFTPQQYDARLTDDPDRARREAEEARAQIVSGEVEFATLRRRQHEELKAAIERTLGEEEAGRFAEMIGVGEFDKPVGAVQSALDESRFALMLGGASVVRNAMVRLERREVSPVWQTPLGFIVARVNGVALRSLEGEYQDHKLATKTDYRFNEFYRWLTSVLGKAKLAD